MVDWVPSEIKQKSSKISLFGEDSFGCDFITNLTTFDVTMDYPSASYNMSFSALKGTVNLSLDTSYSAGLEFKTSYNLINFSMFPTSWGCYYKPGNTEKSNDIAQVAYSAGNFGASKNYTVRTAKNINFVCLNKIQAAAQGIRKDCEDIQEAVTNDHKISLRNTNFNNAVSDALTLTRTMLFPVWIFSQKAVNTINTMAADIQPNLLQNAKNKQNVNLNVITTKHIDISAKTPGESVIFSIADEGNHVNPNHAVGTNKAEIKLNDQQVTVEAKEEVSIQHDADYRIQITKDNDNTKIKISAGSNTAITVCSDKIELKENNNTVTISNNELKMNNCLTCSNTAFEFSKNNLTIASINLSDSEV